MAWRVEFSSSAAKAFAKLDRPFQARLTRYLENRVLANPRKQGTAMKGDQHAWRYRVGDYRLICDLRDADRTLYVVKVGHRRDVYRD